MHCRWEYKTINWRTKNLQLLILVNIITKISLRREVEADARVGWGLDVEVRETSLPLCVDSVRVSHTKNSGFYTTRTTRQQASKLFLYTVQFQGYRTIIIIFDSLILIIAPVVETSLVCSWSVAIVQGSQVNWEVSPGRKTQARSRGTWQVIAQSREALPSL